MEIRLDSRSEAYSYRCQTADHREMNLEGSQSMGAPGNAMSPMETVLSAAAGCSSIDMEDILHKMRQPLESISVVAKAERKEDAPRLFTAIHLHYILSGDLKEDKVVRALELSFDKYCSVVLMLRAGGIQISNSYEIRPGS